MEKMSMQAGSNGTNISLNTTAQTGKMEAMQPDPG
jgi:hypothetical protein